MSSYSVCVQLSWFVLLLALGASGQTAPAGSTAGAAGAAQEAHAPSAGSPPTIRTNAELVVVDVVVTDSAHRPVHGLTAGDFSLKENGAPQTLKHFEEHSALTPADATKFPPMPALPRGIFTNYTPAPASGAVDLLLLDTLNTPLADQSFARQQLLAYLKSVPPGTRIAIFGLAEHLYILQGFTSDPKILRSVLEKDGGKGSPLLDDQLGGGGIQNSITDDMEDDSYVGADLIASLRQFEAENQSFQLQMRIKFTLDAFNQLARYLSNIPGRKNLVWFSGSFPIDILPDTSGTLTDPFAVAANYEEEFRQTVDLLGRGQVAVYPVDARGLTNSPIYNVTTTRNYGGPHGNARMAQDQNKYINDTNNEHTTMNDMAYATGGRAFVDTNDLTHAVAEAIDQGSNFYSLAYTPSDPTLDSKLHKITVQIDRSGVTPAYRRGYYADPPEKVTTNATVPGKTMRDEAVPANNGVSPRDTLRLAMMRGAPTPSDITIRAAVAPMTPASAPEAEPAPDNTPAANARGPWRRYSVNYQINPSDIGIFRTADGKVHGDFDLIIFVYSADGTLVNALTKGMEIAGTLDDIKKQVQQGIFCHEEVSVPAKGESFLRIAVHDLHRDHYGAVEVATSQVQNIAPTEPRSTPPGGAK
jgi:VWFA-related protein